MKRTFPALLLAAALTLTPAFAAAPADLFPAVNEYPGYADVQPTDWFYDSAKLCCEAGLLTGTGAGFSPAATMTVAEGAVLSARLHAALTGDAIRPLAENEPWYEPYFDYLIHTMDIGWSILGEPDFPMPRGLFLSFLDVALPDELLTPINAVTSLPDTSLAEALRFYNAGILTGIDKYGTFAGDRTLTRSEGAAMVARIVRPALRQTFTPADYSPFTAAQTTPDTVFFTTGVTAEAFLTAVNNAITDQEANFLRAGAEFNWHADAGDGRDVLAAVTANVLSALQVTADTGTEAYQGFDYQVYNSRLIDLTVGPLKPDYAPMAGS